MVLSIAFLPVFNIYISVVRLKMKMENNARFGHAGEGEDAGRRRCAPTEVMLGGEWRIHGRPR
jgi:hypothetical protein